MKKTLRILSVLLIVLYVFAALPMQPVRAEEAVSEPPVYESTPDESSASQGEQADSTVPETGGIAQGSASDSSGETVAEESISVTEATTATTSTQQEKEEDSEPKAPRFALTRDVLILVSAVLLLAVAVLAVLLGRTKSQVRQLQDRITELESRPATAPTAPMTSGPEDVTRTSRPAAAPVAANTAPGFFLEGTGGYYSGQRIPVKVQMGFGRDMNCDIRYPSEAGGISKVHCALLPAKDGVVLVDLGSTCGTFLGTGERLKPHHNYLLRRGDRFYLCNPDQAFRIQ